MRKFYTIVFVIPILAGMISCDQRPDHASDHFTKADSLADMYLKLHDTLHLHWNIMINDDNGKIRSMRNLLHELSVTSPAERERFDNFEERIDQLPRIRYTQKSMSNADVVEEYDVASHSLIMELISVAESKREYTYNTTLQKLVDNILSADQRMVRYRQQYDSLAIVYNVFLESNESHLIEANLNPDKKAQFYMTSSE